MQNPYGYNALDSEVYRVLQSGGTIEITGGMSNKFFNSIYNMSAEQLRSMGYTIVTKGVSSGSFVGLRDKGIPVKGTSMEIVLREI